jgi:hypothetical protein
MAQPKLERRRRALGGSEAGAAPLAREQGRQDVLAVPAGDHSRDAGRSGQVGGQHLAPHPTFAERRSRSQLDGSRRRALRNELRTGVTGSTREHTAGVRQQHEQTGADEHGDLSRQRVVVAKGDLIGRRRIVLVHNRHRAKTKERAECIAHVDVGRALGHVTGREQDLRSRESLARERGLPGGLQAGLAEGTGRLQPRHARRPSVET